MKPRILSCVCGLGIALLVQFPASGQTVMPTLTPSALPAGGDLLGKMKEAVRAAGTGRYSIRQPTHGPWLALSVHEVDVSGSVKRLHTLDRTRPPLTPSTSPTRHEQIIVGKREAYRSTYGGWICSVNNRVHADDFSLLVLPSPLTHIVTVGETREAGAIAWHVTAQSTRKASGASEKSRLDFYLDETTLLPIHQDRTTTYYQRGRAPVTGHFRFSYSNFGKPEHITLPKPCRGS